MDHYGSRGAQSGATPAPPPPELSRQHQGSRRPPINATQPRTGRGPGGTGSKTADQSSTSSLPPQINVNAAAPGNTRRTQGAATTGRQAAAATATAVSHIAVPAAPRYHRPPRRPPPSPRQQRTRRTRRGRRGISTSNNLIINKICT